MSDLKMNNDVDILEMQAKDVPVPKFLLGDILAVVQAGQKLQARIIGAQYSLEKACWVYQLSSGVADEKYLITDAEILSLIPRHNNGTFKKIV